MFEAIIEILVIIIFLYIAYKAHGDLRRGRGGAVTRQGQRLRNLALIIGVFAFFATWDLLNNSLAVLWFETEKLSLNIFKFLPLRNSLKPVLLICIVLLVVTAFWFSYFLKKRNQSVSDFLSLKRESFKKTGPRLTGKSTSTNRFEEKYLNSAFLDKFERHISDDDLREICFDLKIDYENLSGDNKRARMRSLLQLLNRESRIKSLIVKLQSFRPNVNW